MDGTEPAPGPSRRRDARRQTNGTGRRHVHKRTAILVDAGVTGVPRGTPRNHLVTANLEVYRSYNPEQIQDTVNDAFAEEGIHMRTGEWEFMNCDRRNMLLPLPGRVDGRRLVEVYKRFDSYVYIRRRQSLAPVVENPQRAAANTAEQANDEPEIIEGPMIGPNEPVIIEDEPAAPTQLEAVEVEEAIFEQAAEDPDPVVEMRSEELKEMLEGWTGPHVTAIKCCAQAGLLRPWPLPLSPMAAEDISSQQERPLVATVGLTEETEETSLAVYTRTVEYFRLFEPATGRRQALLISIDAGSPEGMDYMRRHGLEAGHLPSLVVSLGTDSFVARTMEGGMMDCSIENLHAAMEDYCSVWAL